MSIIGMWMWPYRVRLLGAKKVVSLCARAGVTDLYFLTKGLNGTTAFHGVDAPRDCDRDLLKELLDAAHQKGIRVHAWFTSASDAHYKSLHPDSGRCHYRRGKDCGLIALTDESYLEYMKRIVRDLCSRYEIDGLHLDYIRYNHMVYGWSEEDLLRYAQNGADSKRLHAAIADVYDNHDEDITPLLDAYRSGDPDLLAFAETRRQDVYHFAKTLTDTAREIRPNLILSAALMPEGACTDHAFADLHYGQHYADAASLYDYVLPMAYSQAYDQNAAWVHQVAVNTMAYGVKTIMGLHAYEDGTGMTLSEDITALTDLPIAGICLFREGATVLAFEQSQTLSVNNPLPQTITALRLVYANHTEDIHCDIPSDTEQVFLLSDALVTVRAFCGEDEVSIYLTKQ